MTKKIFIIAGEASGDLIGSKLIKEFNKINNQQYEFLGVGGKLMKEQNFNSIFPLEDLAIMGFVEVLPAIPRIISRINLTIKEIEKFAPDILITIDAPDFCFRILKKLTKKNIFKSIKKVHVVAPSVWAYREYRAKKIAKLYDLLLAILPFEPPYFEKYGLKTIFIGHPLLDEIPDMNIKKEKNDNFRKFFNIDLNDEIILITPGSRIGEVKRIFPEFINSLNLLYENKKNISIIIPVVDKTRELIVEMAKNIKAKYFLIENTHKIDAYYSANYAIAKSGTNAIEASLYEIPLIIAYKINIISYYIARMLIKIKYANLINLVANKEIIPELLQYKCNSFIIYKEIIKLINDKKLVENQLIEVKNSLKIMGSNSINNPMKNATNEILKLCN